jgi:hypothetical protein
VSRADTVVRAGSTSPLVTNPMGRAGYDLASLMAQDLPVPDWSTRSDLVLHDIEQVLRLAAQRAGSQGTAAQGDSPVREL